MTSLNIVMLATLGYALVLFAIAFVYDRQARPSWLGSPLVYTLSISVYCTSWTFYGAVGSAARTGLEYATIYLGPTLVFLGFHTVLRKLLRIRRDQNITSVADLLSSRYGKSDAVAALVTVIVLAATAPYIALQLKAIATSFHVMGAAAERDFSGAAGEPPLATALAITAGLALFTILFGTRKLDANERHYGVIAAIAVEAVVKLVALIGVGVLAVWHLADGPADTLSRIAAAMPAPQEDFGVRWVGLILLSGAAVLCLPRQFQVTVVENVDERHLPTAAWLFPAYLFLMSLFILPIAVMGQSTLPPGSNPDMFVLTMPLAAGRGDVALLAFIGGFSSATSMVIVACIALSTMISNHVVMPLALRSHLLAEWAGRDLRTFLLRTRRLAILLILASGFLYLRLGPSEAGLASIGLVAFAGAAQVLPAMLGALYWSRANRRGAMAGLAAGFAVWLYTLVLPGVLAESATWQGIAAQGPFGIAALRPGALLGLAGTDPLIHALFWSLGLNTLMFVLCSMSRDARPLEQVQGALFVDAFRDQGEDAPAIGGRRASADALFDMAQRVLGPNEAYALFREAAREQDRPDDFPRPDDAFINRLERRLAASIGAASARAMVRRVAGGERISREQLMRMADETAQLIEYSQRLERTSAELQTANARLRMLDQRKDAFLSQVSHELRTPMTSIRSSAEILSGEDEVPAADARAFLDIIHRESIRLTALLDEILDAGTLDHGAGFALEPVDPDAALSRGIDACRGLARRSGVMFHVKRSATGAQIAGRADRLTQVFVNIVSNAIRHGEAASPRVGIASRIEGDDYVATVIDNGPGIAPEDRTAIFETFTRGAAARSQEGAGLGLAISRGILRRMGGDVTLLDTSEGAGFEIRLPLLANVSRETIAAEG